METGGGETSSSSSPREIGEQETTRRNEIVVTIDPDSLHCSICTNSLCSPLYQCLYGHIACFSCWEKVQYKCSTCDEPIVPQNIALEKMLASIQLLFPNTIYGCCRSILYSQMQMHTETCEFGPSLCPIPGCAHKAFSEEEEEVNAKKRKESKEVKVQEEKEGKKKGKKEEAAAKPENKEKKEAKASTSIAAKEKKKPAAKKQGKEKMSEEVKGPTKEELHAVISELLFEVDFETATLADILRQLGAQFKVDLMDRAAEVKQILEDVINSMSEEEDEPKEKVGFCSRP
ncbi:E3 ubiquitin-protein ligase SINA-like 9 [Carex littledalei]|uniref:E3 ubiquitin-protein ligase SINA-like 9 n=1 Tax=Carex littledalei TaxID=544730 RepID=A0A833RSU6_9POAL|nr:E3 ubiquitin-protein ligase SINA-like 9 [Carex littledalei]